jgi:peptidoglycan/xylan/chitin deacetylase (PgdA/CDA1 family)
MPSEERCRRPAGHHLRRGCLARRQANHRDAEAQRHAEKKRRRDHRAKPALANDILRGGHLLENHSCRHSHATNLYAPARLTADLVRAQQAIERHTGTTPRFVRPPLGLSNPLIFGVAEALGLKVVGWDIRGHDTRIIDPAKIGRRIERTLRPGAIILLHDGNIPAERLAATVDLLLARLRQRGYDVARLDRMLSQNMGHETIGVNLARKLASVGK